MKNIFEEDLKLKDLHTIQSQKRLKEASEKAFILAEYESLGRPPQDLVGDQLTQGIEGESSMPEESKAKEVPSDFTFSKSTEGVKEFLEAVSKDVKPDMVVRSFIGDSTYLMEYASSQEQRYRVTMPFNSCGLTTEVFSEATKGIDPAIYTFQFEPEGDEEVGETLMYERLEVEGDYYLSCISTSLDLNYLHSVIVEATTALKIAKTYLFPLVTYRVLIDNENPEEPASLFKTLNLNSFELSVLFSHLEDIAEPPNYVEIDSHRYIRFTSKGDNV